MTRARHFIMLSAFIAAALLWGDAAPSAQPKPGKKGRQRPPALVVVAPVKMVHISPLAEYTGLIQPADKALLSPDTPGRLVNLKKRAGDRVRKGEVLAVLQNPTLVQDLAVMKARVRETEAQVALNEQQQSRLNELYRKKLATAQSYEDGVANLAVMQARLASARVQVDRLQDQMQRLIIRSPIKGQVISAIGEIGQWLSPNQPIFEIFNYDRFELMTGVPGRFLPSVRTKGKVRVTVPEIGSSLSGRIASVIRHVDPATGNFRIRILIDNPGQLPLSGLLAKVRLPLAQARSQLTVPRDAIVRKGNRTHVVLVDQGKARIVPVKVRGNRGDSVIVTGRGLNPEALVVVRGNERLFPGMPVRVSGSDSKKPDKKL